MAKYKVQLKAIPPNVKIIDDVLDIIIRDEVYIFEDTSGDKSFVVSKSAVEYIEKVTEK